MAMEPLIIEVRANEIMKRGDAAQVPYSPEEIVADALACEAAGAAVYHWHGRDPATGKPIDDSDAFIATARGIRERSDIILKPTTGFQRDSAATRMAHIDAMIEADRGYVDIVPVDNFSANADLWDEQTRAFRSGDALYTNMRGHVAEVIGHAAERSLRISLACPDIGAIRTGLCFADMGILPEDLHWELVFSGDTLPLASAPSIPSLQAMVAALPSGASWSCFCTHGDLLPLVGTIVLMGGHVAIGLGDHAHRRFGPISNAELVRKVRSVAEIAGRPVATVEQARHMLRLPLPTGTDQLA